VNYVDTTNINNIIDNITPKTRFIWLETPTNPTLKISDIETIAKIAHQNGAYLVVDNTFASPALQTPLDLGADIIIHSATKYLAGHSDVIAGVVVVKDQDLADKVKFIQNSSGGILGPFDSWLTIRGNETLVLRVTKQSETAQKLAEYLLENDAVDEVFYPGLATHSNHDIAKKQQKLFGGVVSFTLKEDTIEAASAIVCSTKLFKLAESLGGVKSLICHPAQMTHKSIPEETRIASGVKNSLIRVSVGIEHEDDLIEDIKEALRVKLFENETMRQ
jgi:cystathionine beta-lyase